MKQVSINDKIFHVDPHLMGLVAKAQATLDLELTSSHLKDEASASWTLESSEAGSRRIKLTISGEGPPVDRTFSPADIEDTSRLHDLLRRLWGDYLQGLSHKQIQEMTDRASAESFLEGTEALDHIIDSITAYSEREGHQPVSLKLPVRYAAALMKLGPQYWGEFYQGIQTTGLKAFDGGIVLGMRVELVNGVNSSLEVA